jgi:uroporphyrinogen-III synthase
MRLIVTRPREDADALRATLEGLGHSVILSPLLDIVPLADAVVPKEPYQCAAFTSANGIRALPREALARLRALPVFTVGPQSADAARLGGFADVRMAGGDASGLARHIAAACDPRKGPVLYVSGRDSASDFAGRLERAGFSVRRVIAYEAKAASGLPPEIAAGAEAVLLYSPRTASVWAELTARGRLARVARAMMHICISQNTAARLRQSYQRIVADEPNEAGMLAALARLEVKGASKR